MNIEQLSNSGLHLLHNRIWLSLTEDDNLPEGEKRYGMREYPDHQHQANRIEAELERRGTKFSRLPW